MNNKEETYYLNENEDILRFITLNNIDISKNNLNKLLFISEKSNNNYIGYYKFINNDKYIRLFVLPKTIDNCSKNTEKDFARFFSIYHYIVYKYKAIEYKHKNGNITDLCFKGGSQNYSYNIDDFISYKYLNSLKILELFFKKHHKSIQKQTSFSSQVIKSKIDLKKNVQSINKSFVHQIKKEIVNYSEIAVIAKKTIISFKKNKLPYIYVKNLKEIQKLTDTVSNYIGKRFKLKKTFNFKSSDILTNKIIKLFRKNSELKNVYEAILILLGMEHFKSSEATSETKHIPNMTALFFRPEKLYEWIVYDKLKEEFPKAEILSGNENKKDYILQSGKIKDTRSSEPDFVVIDNDIVTIIDAKWKILKNIKNIQFEDIAKLERDWIIRKNKYPSTKASLIYPKIEFDYNENENYKHNYNPDFEFSIREIKI